MLPSSSIASNSATFHPTPATAQLHPGMAFSPPFLAPKPWIRRMEELPPPLLQPKNDSIAIVLLSLRRFQQKMNSTDPRTLPQDCPPPRRGNWQSTGYRQSAESQQSQLFWREARDRNR